MKHKDREMQYYSWIDTNKDNQRLNDIVDEAIKEVIEEDYKDMINPEHYKIGGIETIDFMKAKSTKEEFLGHLRLTALKYLSRFGKKDDELQELKKAKWYLDRLISELEQ